MKLHLKQLLVTRIELAAGVFVTLGIILFANSRQLLNYYGLQSSNELIKSNAGRTVNDALKSIDSLGATNGVVTFLIWAAVGVVCFGIVEAIGSAYAEVRFENELSSKAYVHPLTFTKAKFWRSVMTSSATFGFGLLMLLAATLFFVLLLVPVGLTYTRVFLFDASLSSAAYMLLGIALLFVGLMLLDIVIRFLFHRHRIISTT